MCKTVYECYERREERLCSVFPLHILHSAYLQQCHQTVCVSTQIQQNIHVAVAEYAKLKQQLEKNTVIITMLGHVKEVHHAYKEVTICRTLIKSVADKSWNCDHP